MTRGSHDVLIVGARCAGAALATFLARRGLSVLALDKDALGSDQVLSTHTIHPPGIDVLDELGVGEALRRTTPATRVLRLQKDAAAVDVRYAHGRAGYCPRRWRLDSWLQAAAGSAGVELRGRTRVVGLMREKGRVVGVRAETGGRERTYRARLVVGADGRRSTIARLVGAAEYLAYDAPRAMYWAYWDAPSWWGSDAGPPFGMYVGHVGDAVRVIFRTNDDQVLIGSLPDVRDRDRWRADPLATLTADLDSDPTTGPLVRGRPPREKVRGTAAERYFFRESAGPGWVLVGDAGHHKEFVLGDGITEALLQARSLAAAIVERGDAALERWWRARDVRALPLFFFGQDEGAPGSSGALQPVVFAHVQRSPALRARMAGIVEHELSPYDVFPVARVLAWAVGAALRGRPAALAEFAAAGRRASQVARELRRRRRLLAEAAPRGEPAFEAGS